jgi:hypothetical protein
MTDAAGTPPIANRAVVSGELKRALRRRPDSRQTALLLRAAPQWRGPAEFDVEIAEDRVIRVAVADCPTVLSVLDALSVSRPSGTYLAVLTPRETHEVGESVLARAIIPEVRPINRWDLVQDAFGTPHLDPKLRGERWLAEALLDAQPEGGWRRLAGPVLTFGTAMNRLVMTRLRMNAEVDENGVDAASLLEWTARDAVVADFGQLRDSERDGIVAWLRETVGPVAEVTFAMGATGKIADAIPFGLAAAALYGPDDVVTAQVRAEERYFGGKAPDRAVLKVFGEVAESLVARWTDNGHAPQAAMMCERAERILFDLFGADASETAEVARVAAESKVLDAGLDARLVALAEELETSLPEAEEALRRVREHRRRHDRYQEIAAAEAAVRVARWLTTPDEEPSTLAEAATSMLRSWGWVDRALNVIERADTSRVPRLAPAYAKLWQTAKKRRAYLDSSFARKLAAWTQNSGTPRDLLLVENLMARVARPIADMRPPVIVVLDGMSVAVGCELAEEVAASGLWMEAGRREDGREPALATVPSITSISRTSLLTGTLRSGAQPEENAGFGAFWGKRKSRLFHKGDLSPAPGCPLSDDVRDAILDPDMVVGVVLNTIDDTLDKGKNGGIARWAVDDVTYLRVILDQARRAGRPVILTADHGHVLDQDQPAREPRGDTARFRSGTAVGGEVTIRGPRVIVGGGEVVAAVDEAIRYAPRRAGYHGGASAAEVVVPVFVLLPSASLLPPGWTAYDAAGHAPDWWDPPVATVPDPAQIPRRKRQPVSSGMDTLFEAPVPAATATALSLGQQIVASARMASQRQFARRAPDNASVAALIDGLDQAGGRLTIAEAAHLAGESPVRMSGYIAQTGRLLNVDGYRVIGASDGGRTVVLDTVLLKQQFLGG